MNGISIGCLLSYFPEMKFLGFVFCFLCFFAISTFATNPGSNYGCLVWNQRFYVNSWYKTDHAPENPYWSPHQFYDSKIGQSYAVVDNSNNVCGTINPYTGGGTQNGSCFVLVGSNPNVATSYSQGVVQSFTVNQATPCPIDKNVWILIILVSLIAFFKINYRSSSFSFKTFSSKS